MTRTSIIGGGNSSNSTVVIPRIGIRILSNRSVVNDKSNLLVRSDRPVFLRAWFVSLSVSLLLIRWWKWTRIDGRSSVNLYYLAVVKRRAREKRDRVKEEMAEKFVLQKNMANTCETPRSRRRNRPTFLDLSNITRESFSSHIYHAHYIPACLSLFVHRSKESRDLDSTELQRDEKFGKFRCCLHLIT